MNVLLCAPNSGPAGGILRWTEHLWKYYENLNDKEFVIDILDTGLSADRRVNPPVTYRIRTGIKEYTRIYKSFVQCIREQHYDLVHFTSSASLGLVKDLFMLRKAKKKGSRTILHFHFGRIPDLYRKPNWEQKLLDRVIRQADRVVVIDKASYDTLLSNGYDHVDLLPNPLTPAVSSIIEAHRDVVRQDRKLLFAGHVIETKGVFELIDACKGLDRIKLKVIGAVSDEMRVKLLHRAGKGCEAWLEIAGELDFETTIKEMLSAGVFVLPTYTEGFPNVVIESMACGCPIVATDVGAIPEMLDIEQGFQNGICVKPRDAEQFRSAVRKMLDDREYALRCGCNAQQRVRMLYAMPQVWKRLTGIWRKSV